MAVNKTTALITLLLLAVGCTAGSGKSTEGDAGNGGVIVKEVKNADRTITSIFYRGDQEVAQLKRDQRESIIEATGVIPDGIVRQYYESGKLMEETRYKDGKREGLCRWYYETGVVKGERPYKEDKLNGIIKWYYTTGSLGTEFNYTNGTLEGLTKLYWENGNIKAEHYYENGRRDGINKQYYPGGEIRFVDTYRGGKQINRKEYNPSGKIISTKEY